MQAIPGADIIASTGIVMTVVARIRWLRYCCLLPDGTCHAMIKVGRWYLLNRASVPVLYHHFRLLACLKGLILVFRPVSGQRCKLRAARGIVLERHLLRARSAGRAHPCLGKDGGAGFVGTLGLTPSPKVKSGG